MYMPRHTAKLNTVCHFLLKPYEIGSVQRAVASKFGNLAFYRGTSRNADREIALLSAIKHFLVHAHGGHFPALDSSNEFIEDVRDFFKQNYA